MSSTSLPPEQYADRARNAEAAGQHSLAAEYWTKARTASAGHGRRAGYDAQADRCRKAALAKQRWQIYIPNEGHWPIAYDGDDEQKAKQKYLDWAERKTLPRGSKVMRTGL